MLSGSSPIFPLSNHTTCSQTQTGATVPLKTDFYWSESERNILESGKKTASVNANSLPKENRIGKGLEKYGISSGRLRTAGYSS
jgi:hypothetical protein